MRIKPLAYIEGIPLTLDLLQYSEIARMTYELIDKMKGKEYLSLSEVTACYLFGEKIRSKISVLERNIKSGNTPHHYTYLLEQIKDQLKDFYRDKGDFRVLEFERLEDLEEIKLSGLSVRIIPER